MLFRSDPRSHTIHQGPIACIYLLSFARDVSFSISDARAWLRLGTGAVRRQRARQHRSPRMDSYVNHYFNLCVEQLCLIRPDSAVERLVLRVSLERSENQLITKNLRLKGTTIASFSLSLSLSVCVCRPLCTTVTYLLFKARDRVRE